MAAAESRLANSMRNVLVAWGGQGMSVILSFVTRGVFAYLLAKDYVGLENLFSNVITMLCVADLGIGSAIIFALYKPIAEGDTEKVKSLMRLFKIAYITIGVIIAVAGFAISPFITNFIQDAPDIPYLNQYFLCFVLNAAISYFFSYKGSLIYAHQKSYVVALIQYSFQIGMCLVQIALLYLTGSYWVYLGVMLASTLGQNIVLARTADKMYPFIKERNVQKLDSETFSMIKKNTFALILHKISGAMSVSIGSIFVSAFAGLAAIASYGSYMIVLNAVSRIVDKAFDAVTASIGNMGASESGERQYDIFKVGLMVSAGMYTVICCCLACSFSPFVGIWLGESYIFGDFTTYLLCIWLFVKGVRCAEQAFTSAYGLYWHTRYKALAEAIALPIASYIGVQVVGVDGVVASGIVVMLFVSTLLEVRGLYKHGFKRAGMAEYWLRMLGYSVLFVAVTALSVVLCKLAGLTGVVAVLVNVAIGLVVSIAGFVAVNFRTPEFAYVWDLMGRLGGKLRAKFSR